MSANYVLPTIYDIISNSLEVTILFVAKNTAKNIKGESLKFKPAKKKAASSKPKSSFHFKVLNTSITLFFLFLSSLVMVTAIYPSYQSQLKQRKETQKLQAKLASLKQKNQHMEEEIGRLQTDDYVERIARKDLGFVKPGESAYVLVPPASDDEIKPVAKPAKKEKTPEPFWLRISIFFENLLP